MFFIFAFSITISSVILKKPLHIVSGGGLFNALSGLWCARDKGNRNEERR